MLWTSPYANMIMEWSYLLYFEFPFLTTTVYSTNINLSLLNAFSKSVTDIVNNNGSSIDPWGIPSFHFCHKSKNIRDMHPVCKIQSYLFPATPMYLRFMKMMSYQPYQKSLLNSKSYKLFHPVLSRLFCFVWTRW